MNVIKSRGSVDVSIRAFRTVPLDEIAPTMVV